MQAYRPNFAGLRVAAFESRRAEEIKNLIEKFGGRPLVAPSMREVAPEKNPAAIDFAHRLMTGGIDVVISACALTGLSMPFGIIAVLIKYSSDGPVFYKQERMGLDGKAFQVYKFRSMYPGA